MGNLVPVLGDSKYEAIKALRPHFYADDCAVHCREERDAMVPEIVRIHAWGLEQLPDGVCKYPDVATSLCSPMPESPRRWGAYRVRSTVSLALA